MLYEISDDLRQNYKITQEGISQLRAYNDGNTRNSTVFKGICSGNYGDSSWKFDELPDNTFTTEFPSINRMYECILSDKTSYIGSRVTVNNLMNGSDMVLPHISAIMTDMIKAGQMMNVFIQNGRIILQVLLYKDESPVNLKKR